MQEAYIVAGYRTAVGKAKSGGFRFYRPDDLAIDVIKGLMASVPQLDAAQSRRCDRRKCRARSRARIAGRTHHRCPGSGFHAPGMTVNRYCASGS